MLFATGARLLFRSLGGFRTLRYMTMESYEDYLVPPEAVRGCTKLDKAAFDRKFEFHCVRLSNPKLCTTFINRLSHARVKCPYVKGVVPVLGSGDLKPKELMIMLGPTPMVQKLLTDEDRSWIAANEGEELTHTVKLGYNDFSRWTILRAILPPELEVVSGFEEAGHIAHYNLKQDYLPYKETIGQVTVDKVKTIRTVVNKVDELGATSAFRFFKMELLAGEDDYIACVNENQCTFTMDYSKLYWNSRLEREHREIVNLFKPSEVVLDVFAGIGPFAIPAAKKQRCFVHANDLNPHSYTYLLQNIKDNGVSDRVLGYNLDGREFINSVSRKLIEQSLSSFHESETVTPYSHVVMNLPGNATSFLEAFRGVFSGIPVELRHRVSLPLIHCYCFADNDNNREGSESGKMDPVQNVTTHLGVEELEEGQYSVHKVRSVSRITLMMRVSFRLPPEVAYLQCKDVADSVKESKAVHETGGCERGCGLGEDITGSLETGENVDRDGHYAISTPPQSLSAAEFDLDEQNSARFEENPEDNMPESKRLKMEN